MRKEIPFIKMHGAGNDFVVISQDEVRMKWTGPLVRKILDRHFGVGADQLLLMSMKGRRGVPKLVIYNPDGSRAEMCGNGVRAVAHYLRLQKGFRKLFAIETDSGVHEIRFKAGHIEVDMGWPILEGRKIPVRASGEIIRRPLQIKGKTYHIHCVSMGNPHCVLFVQKVNSFPVSVVGPLIEHHPFFPKRVNVEFVEVLSGHHVRARVWERGVGETLACGSGACAIGVAGQRAGRTRSNLRIDLPGGRLQVRMGNNGRVYLSGPAEISFKGVFNIAG